jgi:hypothetical protein
MKQFLKKPEKSDPYVSPAEKEFSTATQSKPQDQMKAVIAQQDEANLNASLETENIRGSLFTCTDMHKNITKKGKGKTHVFKHYKTYKENPRAEDVQQFTPDNYKTSLKRKQWIFKKNQKVFGSTSKSFSYLRLF